jgi:deoxyribodipyrimidine photolyase-related protein
MMSHMKTVWVLGDQLNRRIGALDGVTPDTARVLLVESDAMISGRRFHRQRIHYVLTSMRRFALQLRRSGFDVDLRQAPTLRAGLLGHVDEFNPPAVTATEPNSRAVETLLGALDVELAPSNQFLCHRDEFARWAGDRTRLRLEDFYRWQRRRLGYLMDDGEPAGGSWNFDHDNREPPPRDGGSWPRPVSSRLDALDLEVIDSLPNDAPGDDPVGWWATSRRGALARLRHFIDDVLPLFGPHEDAMVESSWHLAHSLLSPYLNLGLLLPTEVCDRVEDAYRAGRVPINSAEGVIRQIIGWREFVWGVYWLWPDQYDANTLEHARALPPSWTGEATTAMRCVATALDGIRRRAWVHHIQRLMVLSNFANLYGIEPARVRDWMRDNFVDGANWVMGPNVMGMGLWADGGRMSTKPYVSGGAYINRMSDHCANCAFDPTKRTGDDACPFTTLYWEFLDRHRDTLQSNARMARQYSTLDRLGDLPQVHARAGEVAAAIAEGRL